MPMNDMLGGAPKGRGRGTSTNGASMVDFIKRAWNSNPLESARTYLNNPDPEGYQRANVLPYATNADGETEWAVPSMGRDIMREGLAGLEAPKRVFDGEVTPEQGAFDTALATMGAGLVGGRYVPKGALTANVWQGGPHKYGPEGAAKSLDHIGKGEGAQAYGWGRYDAGSEAVGRQYQEQVSGDFWVTPDGELFNPTTLEHMNARSRIGRNPDIDAELPELREIAKRQDGTDAGAMMQRDIAKLEALQKKGGLSPSDGNLYKHDLPDEDIARYLDWDKPLSEQPESVRAALEQTGVLAEMRAKSAVSMSGFDEKLAALGKPPHFGDGKIRDYSGQEIYNAMVERAKGLDGTGSPVDFDAAYRQGSEALGNAGIPGLQYYDGMSRNAGEGTRNYVTWDQGVLDRMKLLERNGEDMTLAMGGSPEAYAMTNMLGGNQQPQQGMTQGQMARWLADPRNM